MDRRDFLSASAAAVAAPAALMLGEREAIAVEEDCSWHLPEGDGVVDKVLYEWRSANSVTFMGDTIAELGVWARGKRSLEFDGTADFVAFTDDPDYDKASEHLAELINDVRRREFTNVRSPDCELDPNLMVGSLRWARTMAVRGWQGGGRRRRRRRRRRRGGGGFNHDTENGAAEIVATSGDYKSAVRIWRGSPGHARIMYASRYTRMGAGVARSKRGAWFMVARFT